MFVCTYKQKLKDEFFKEPHRRTNSQRIFNIRIINYRRGSSQTMEIIQRKERQHRRISVYFRNIKKVNKVSHPRVVNKERKEVSKLISKNSPPRNIGFNLTSKLRLAIFNICHIACIRQLIIIDSIEEAVIIHIVITVT